MLQKYTPLLFIGIIFLRTTRLTFGQKRRLKARKKAHQVMKIKHTFKGSVNPIFQNLTFNTRTIQLRLKVNRFYEKMLCKGIINERVKRNKNKSKIGVTHVILLHLRKMVTVLSMNGYVLLMWVSNARYQINVK